MLLFSELFDHHSAALYVHCTGCRWWLYALYCAVHLQFIWSFNRALDYLVLLFSKSNNINSKPPNNDKTWCSHTGNLKLYFLISRLSGEKHGNDIHAQKGNNQKARYKVCCKLVWTLSPVVHLHTFFEHIAGGQNVKWLLQISKVYQNSLNM